MSFTKITAIVVAVALTGCANQLPKFQTETGVVQWHKVLTLADMQRVCTTLGQKYPDTILGCYKMDSDNVCHIYVIDKQMYLETLGHELKHCFDGRWHDIHGNADHPIDKQVL